MGSNAEAWAKQEAYYDRLALIEKAKFQRERAEKAEAKVSLQYDRLVEASERLTAARALADELAEALRLEVDDHECDEGCPSRAALAKWEASR